MKLISYFSIFLIIIGCNTTQNRNDIEGGNQVDSVTYNVKKSEQLQVQKPIKPIYLNGIYEYDYPYKTKGMNENQYLAFLNNGDKIQGWYFGTSDEFDEAREGYLPGYFVSKIQGLLINGDSIFFNIATGFNKCYSERFPIGLVDSVTLNKNYEKWHTIGDSYSINYAGKVEGLKLNINMFGETRVYRKTRNYFHIGTDNYDSTKCQSERLLAMHKNLDNLSDTLVYNFLNTFSVICEANVEFGEWSNELLFKALLNSPEILLNVLYNNSSNLDTASIFKELNSPINDLIPIDSIRTKIELLEVDDEVKNLVLKNLGN